MPRAWKEFFTFFTEFRLDAYLPHRCQVADADAGGVKIAVILVCEVLLLLHLCLLSVTCSTDIPHDSSTAGKGETHEFTNFPHSAADSDDESSDQAKVFSINRSSPCNWFYRRLHISLFEQVFVVCDLFGLSCQESFFFFSFFVFFRAEGQIAIVDTASNSDANSLCSFQALTQWIFIIDMWNETWNEIKC